MNRDLQARIGHDIGDAMDLLFRRVEQSRKSKRDGSEPNKPLPANE
jgi:hypothetical protein